MTNKTLFLTPKGFNRWSNYIITPILIFFLLGLLCIPIYIFDAIEKNRSSYLKELWPSAMVTFSTFLILKWIY